MPGRATWELWSGAEASQEAWSIYSGASWAPFTGIHDDGLRLRVVLGQGDYHTGTVTYGDLLIGYHKQLGAFTVKLFGGLAFANHATWEGPYAHSGGKGVLETWWTISDRAWASADVAVSSTRINPPSNDYGSRVRLGWRLWPELSVGLEGGAGGPIDATPAPPDTARIGGFLRYEWAAGEVSVSGGLAFKEPVPGVHDDGPGAFATVSLLTRF